LNLSPRSILVLCLLTAAAAATWYFSRPPQPGAAAARDGAGGPPSYYLRDAVLLQTDDDGRVLYRIHADLVEERPDDRALLLDGVRIEYRDAEEIPWQVRAGRAAAWIESQSLELHDGVELVRDPGESGVPTVVRTEQLLLEPRRHLASAEGEVVFTVGRNTLAAVGLKAFLKEDRLELESNVHGRFQP
jgi:lipopolysaccharide export system protein LptC